MEEVKQYIQTEGIDKYKEAQNLCKVESKNDPQNDPYRSRYKEREILSEIHATVKKLAENNGCEDDVTLKVMLCSLEYALGINYSDTEETSTAEEHFTKCLESLDKFKMNKDAVNLYQKTLNQIGILWANRRKPDTALSYLSKAENLYKKYKEEVGDAPYTAEHYFVEKTPDEGKFESQCMLNFEDTHTHTLYFLAQVYASLEENGKSAEYCQMTLRRQLETMKYEPIDWAVNAAALSQFYITQNNYTLARHCLASASLIIQEASLPDPATDADIEAQEKLPKAKADIGRCWSKYGLALLDASAAKMLNEVNDNEDSEENNERDQDDDDKQNRNVLFDLELTIHENKITDKFVKTYDQARDVFQCIQKWLNSAKEFYTINSFCVDYVEIVQDLSKAYKLLAFFETSFDRQCKMHKRRVDMLEETLKELNPQFYLMICRQLMYEMAETYSAMLDLKHAIIEENESPPTPHAMKKINTLAQQSINQYTKYLDTLRDSNKKLPETFADEDERPALIAYFCMGRLHSKFIEFDPGKRIANIQKSIDCYKYIVDYCITNPSAEAKVSEERLICEQMVTLLPKKMDKIRAEIMQ